MKTKRLICALLLVALMLSLGVNASAAKKASIKFPAKMGLVLEGKSVTLKPKLSGVKASQLSWSSSDEAVMTVSGGKLSALKPGKAVLTATSGGASAKCGVVVLPANITLAVGEKLTLPRGGKETYKMKNTKLASVSKKGVVKAKKPGKTKLTVKYGKQSVKIPVVVTVGTALTQSVAASLDCAATAQQIVLVDYTGGSAARLSVHEKKDGVWTELFSCAAYVGKNGIGKTVEGDKKTPEGTYNLTTPFGIKDDPGAAMPYTKVTKYHYWCGDSSSPYYNQLVDERIADRAHTGSDEYLINYKGVYNYCLFIDYNASGEAHKGSCIFLHCTGSNKYTAGCVAVSEANMKKILCWARAGAKIVIRGK